MFDKRLLFLACRHHILEVLSAAVFDKFFKSSGPQIALFGRFKEQWKFINTTQYATIDAPASKSQLTSCEKAWLCQRKLHMINFLHNYSSQGAQPRQDYLEFITLALVCWVVWVLYLLLLLADMIMINKCWFISVHQVPTIEPLDGKRNLLPQNLLVS